MQGCHGAPFLCQPAWPIVIIRMFSYKLVCLLCALRRSGCGPQPWSMQHMWWPAQLLCYSCLVSVSEKWSDCLCAVQGCL